MLDRGDPSGYPSKLHARVSQAVSPREGFPGGGNAPCERGRSGILDRALPADECRTDGRAGTHLRQSTEEQLSSFEQRDDRHGLEAFEHEPHLTRARLDSRPHALAPVPASASDSPIVAPDDFTSGDDLHLRNAVLDRVEGLVACRPN